MKTITYRKLKKVDNQKFSEDIKSMLSSLPNTTKVEDKVNNCSAVTLNTVDKHAPTLTKQIKINPQAPGLMLNMPPSAESVGNQRRSSNVLVPQRIKNDTHV